MYAEKVGSKVTENYLDYIYVFRATINQLFEEAAKLIVNADLWEKKLPGACFTCATDSKKLHRCSKCMLAKYCSGACQREHWREIHKRLCPQSEILLRLAALPRHPFENHFNFTRNQDDSLPSYIYNENFVIFESNSARYNIKCFELIFLA